MIRNFQVKSIGIGHIGSITKFATSPTPNYEALTLLRLMICGGQAYTRLWMLTMFLGFDMRKCWATWAGSRLNRILLLSSFTFSMSSLSSSAWMNNHTTHTHTHAHTHTRTHTTRTQHTHRWRQRGETSQNGMQIQSETDALLFKHNTASVQHKAHREM